MLCLRCYTLPPFKKKKKVAVFSAKVRGNQNNVTAALSNVNRFFLSREKWKERGFEIETT